MQRRGVTAVNCPNMFESNLHVPSNTDTENWDAAKQEAHQFLAVLLSTTCARELPSSCRKETVQGQISVFALGDARAVGEDREEGWQHPHRECSLQVLDNDRRSRICSKQINSQRRRSVWGRSTKEK